MIRSLAFVIPGNLDTRTGGYGYDRRMIDGLRGRGWTVDVRQLSDGFPLPTPEARREAVRVLGSMPDRAMVLIDGLAFGALPVELEREAARLALVALVHHPLAAETGLDRDIARSLEVNERRALATARLVMVTSRRTAAALSAYGVSSDRIVVVEPGTDRAALSRGREAGAPVRLLCVATLTPRKGYALLFAALASIPERGWQLTCAGSVDRDAATVRGLLAQLRTSGIDDRVRLAGDLDSSQLNDCYAAADLFVLPTFYEGYGMAVAEALARGLPVISTATGAIEDLVVGGVAKAGIVLPPGDQAALAAALSRTIRNDAGLAALADGARQVRNTLGTWDDACSRIAAALENCVWSER